MSRRAAFVDRDGTINRLVADPVTGCPESPLRVDDVALLPGVAAGLCGLAKAGWLLVGVSNQPAAAKGTVALPQLLQVQARVLELLAEEGTRFDDFRLCLHHPDGVVPGLSGDCECRKPRPGMLLDASHALGIDLAASWMIGDSDSDVAAGRAAGCGTILVEHPSSRHRRTGSVNPDAQAPSLTAAIAWIRRREQIQCSGGR